jgi:putative addiction module killer protein
VVLTVALQNDGSDAFACHLIGVKIRKTGLPFTFAHLVFTNEAKSALVVALTIPSKLSIKKHMRHEIVRTRVFGDWLNGLRDRHAKTIIAARIERIAVGNLGDVKTLGGGLSELRISFGPGYRIYFTVENGQVIILLAGGDKSSQQRDISKARDMM